MSAPRSSIAASFLQARRGRRRRLAARLLPADARGGGRQPAATPRKLNAFVHVGTDDTVTLFIHKAEMGQGTVTSLSMLLAEELECDWTKIRTEFPGVEPAYGRSQGVFGSQSIRTSWKPLRQAGATAREMLVQAAAQKWGVDKVARAAPRTAPSSIPRRNARLSYGAWPKPRRSCRCPPTPR